MILYINACVRAESRTNKIAKELLKKSGKEYQEIKLSELNLQPLRQNTLEIRTNLIEDGNFSSSIFALAKQFAAADDIIIATPFWNSSFPADLKLYIDSIYVIGIVSKYDADGTLIGLCKAKNLYYITTAGGKYIPDFSYEYIKTLSHYFGIPKTKLIVAEMLDIAGSNPDKIIAETISKHYID